MSDLENIIDRLKKLGATIHLTSDSDPDSDPDPKFEAQLKRDKKNLISRALLNTYLIKTSEEILKDYTHGLNKYLEIFYKNLCNVIREIINSNSDIFGDQFKDIVPKGVKISQKQKSKLISDEMIKFFKHGENLFNVNMPFESDKRVSLHFPLVDETNNQFYQCFETAMQINPGDDDGGELLNRIKMLQEHVNDEGESRVMSISDRLMEHSEIRGDELVASVRAAAASQELSGAMDKIDGVTTDAATQIHPVERTLTAVSEGRSNPGPRPDNKKSRKSRSCWSCGSRPDKAGGKKKKKRRRTNRKKIRQTKHKQYKKTKRYKKKSKSH